MYSPSLHMTVEECGEDGLKVLVGQYLYRQAGALGHLVLMDTGVSFLKGLLLLQGV